MKQSQHQLHQNRYLWRYWLYEKNRMRELKTNGRDITTQKLWHGTGPTEPRDIYMGQEGFDVRYSRPGLWGRGIYFALSALYSASGFGHPPVGPDNEYRGCIMLAEVLVGDSYRCRPGTYHENRPPKKEANGRCPPFWPPKMCKPCKSAFASANS